MPDIKDVSYAFEAVKVALRQSKDGIVVSFVIHPNDVPTPLLSDSIGSRYMIGMARIGDDEQVVEPDGVREGKRMVTSCAALCRDNDFQSWMADNSFSDEETEEAAAFAVRRILRIKSRAELKNNISAQNRWTIMRRHFIDRTILMETDIE